MTREEILEKIKYRGEYNDLVKKRLKRLIKQYHPDVNKNDKETILLLYEIKKELENGSINYTPDISQDNKNDNINYDYIVFIFESVIESLKNKRDEINDKISHLYKRYNMKIDEKNEKTLELSELVFEIENLNDEISDYKKMDILDVLLITAFIVTLFCILFFKLYFLILVAIFFIIAEVYYIYVRYLDYKYKKFLLRKYKRKKKSIDKEFNSIEDNLNEMRKEEIDLKKEKSNVNNDIQYYSYEISKINDNESSKSKENGYAKK